VSELEDCCGSVLVSCCCYRLVAGSRTVREPRVRGTSAVGSRYRATASNDVTVDTTLHVIAINEVWSRVA
jgi:hypothetical protein